jgi:hypothetical protein
VIARENCPLADSFGLPFSAAVVDRYITLRGVLYVLARLLLSHVVPFA